MKTNQDIIKEYGKSDIDTGSAEVQVALLSNRIDHLTDHLKTHKTNENTHFTLDHFHSFLGLGEGIKYFRPEHWIL